MPCRTSLPASLSMTNAEIAAVFEQIADLLEFQGANPFRIRAYRTGARAIGDLPEAVDDILTDDKRELTDLAGIGKDLAQQKIHWQHHQPDSTIYKLHPPEDDSRYRQESHISKEDFDQIIHIR